MNFNTFFLDKLTSGTDSVVPSSGKNSLSSFLFSDIMKVCEQENGLNTASQLNTSNPIENTSSSLAFPSDAIECSDENLKSLSDFIKSFMANSKEPINVSELEHNLAPVEITKKQFLLSSGGMESFIKGLVENINLNLGKDLTTAAVSGSGSRADITKITADIKNSENETDLATGKEGVNNGPDPALLNGLPMLQPILQFLAVNKSFSISFKSNLEKININLYELPEDNFETKINIEKITSDLMNVGKQGNGAQPGFINISDVEEKKNSSETSLTVNSILGNPKSTPAEPTLSAGIPQQAVNPAELKSLPPENVYKTEIIEIAYTPKSKTENLSPTINYKTKNSAADPFVLSNYNFNETELSDVKFRLTDKLAASLNIDMPAEKNILSSPKLSPNQKIQNPDTLINNLANLNQPDQSVSENLKEKLTAQLTGKTDPAASSSSARTEAQNPNKLLNALAALNQIDKSLLSDSSGKPSSAPQQSSNEPAAPVLSTSPETLNSSVPVNNFSSASVADKTILTNSADRQRLIDGANVLLNKLNGKLVSAEIETSTGKKDNTKVLENDPGLNSVSKENVKVNGLPNNRTETQVSELKELADYTAGGFKSKVPGAESIPGNAEPNDSKNLINLISGKLAGSEFKKAISKNEQAETKENNVKTVSNEGGSEKGISVKETEDKSGNPNDLNRNKSDENFKNILQGAEQIKANNSDKFKIAAELKNTPDAPKIIKTNEIIPELSKLIQTGEKQSMTFQLTPENLGKVKLIVELVQNQIHTHIEVENEQVKQFVQSNVEQLRQNLQSTGIQLSAVNVSLTESEQKFSKSFTPRKKSGERIIKVKESDEHTSPTQKSLGYNTYEFLA